MSKPSGDKRRRRQKRREKQARAKRSGDPAADGAVATVVELQEKSTGRLIRVTGLNSPHKSALAKSKPWPRTSRYIEECLGAMGATLSILGNHYAPAFPGDEVFKWCLCYGCGSPFQYWGAFGVEAADGGPIDLDWVGVGPCTHCGGAGRPLTMLVATPTAPGQHSAIVSNELALDYVSELGAIVSDLRSGEIDVEQAATRLRAEGGPLVRVADWIESRPATTTVVVGILGVLATLLGPQVDRPEPVDEQQIERIIDEMLEHYEDVTEEPRKGQAPKGKRGR